MKRLILVSALLCGFVCANSQTMYFWKNNVALAAEASALGVMQYTQNGTALTVVDSVMDLQNIDSITVGTPVDESTVRVDYSSNGATAVVPFSLSRKVAVSISGAYVNAVSTALYGNDIVYSLSGKSSDGAFLQTGTYKCTVQLNGLELTSLQGAAINIANGKRIKMILADGTMGQMMEPVSLDMGEVQSYDKSWAVTGTQGKRRHNIVNSLSLLPEELEQWNIARYERYHTIEENETMVEKFMADDAEIVVVAFGVAARVARNAIVAAREKGIKAGLIRPITLWPFPKKQLRDAAKHAKAFVSVELSMGQMIEDVELSIRCARPVLLCSRVGGMIPTPEEVLAKIEEAARTGGDEA